MTEDQAETIAAQALGWLASDPDLMGVFLGASGMSIDDLRGGAGSPEILGAVLDFVCMDDDWVVRFCDDTGRRYEDPARARAVLAGPAGMHWT
ncbi:DUF3572 family protein [Mesobaculum littorinae]|uniref:DUF3572 family protein n=1 Tax=Mesobaculum littorinae TaxID=2486419 RepID=A0A438AJM2_9RHOB|nr:DUF3572 domain-containing protein [Mesobaculum littorinae]RVV98807.1 DUF3572 family protein [Mesobaculum littorinae]